MRRLRKNLSLILAAACGLQGIILPAHAQTVYDKAIPGWVVTYTDDAVGDVAFENGQEENDAAVALNSSGKKNISIVQSVETEAGKSYECIVKLKTKNLNGAYLYAGKSKCDIRQGTNDWSEYRFLFSANESLTDVGIVINDSGSVIVDNVSVCEKNGGEIAMVNADFNGGGEETSSSEVSVSSGIDTDKDMFSKEEIPYLYSSQKKVPLFYADGITIDADASDWLGYPSVYMPTDPEQVAKLKAWSGNDDLSANVYMAYDEESFYLCAVVKDDEHMIKPEQYWAADCIQLGFTDNGNYGPEIGLYFDENGNYIDSPIGKQSEMTFKGKRDGEYSIYEYKIPWTTLYSKKPDDFIVFNVLVDDGDNNQREAFVEWTPGIGYDKSPDSITMEFIEKEDSNFAQWIDAPKEVTVNQSQSIRVNLLNRGEKAETRTVKIPSLDFEKTVEVPAGTLLRISEVYKSEKVGTDTISVSIEGEETKYLSHSVRVLEKERYQNLDVSNLEGGKLARLERLIEECKQKGIATDYEEIDLNVIKRFIRYYKEDIDNGYKERATYVANNLERLADESIENLTAYLNGTKTAVSVQKYLGGELEIDGYNILAETKDSVTGEISKRPVFLAGYGHTTDARNDLADLPNYGTSIYQTEMGVYHTVVGYSATPDAENIMDRFIFSDDRFNERIAPAIEDAKRTNQAIDIILSPHYFPAFVQSAHPETKAPNQIGMNRGINLYAEKSKEVVEAHTRYLLNKIKDESVIRSICLTNEPAMDVRNCFELGNMDNTITAQWVEYLEGKYTTISKLNKTYNSDYASFEEVPMITKTSNDVQTYDWVIFNNKMFADWHEWLGGIVHEIMPDIPIHSKIMDVVNADVAIVRGTDPELFAEFCQYSGNDAYFCWPSSNPMAKYAWYDFEASMKVMPIFDSENHIITDGDSNFIPEHAYQNGTDLWQGALHGRALTCIWVWGRDNAEKSALNGSLLFRPDVVSELGKNMLDLSRLSNEIASINNEPYKVGVLYSWTSRILEPSFAYSRGSAYGGGSYSGEKTYFITEKQLAERNFRDLKVIVVPNAPNVSEETVAGLKEFIENGGKVFIMGGASLTKNERNEKIHSEELKFVQENSVYWDKDSKKISTSDEIADYLLEAYKDIDGMGDVVLVDVETGKPVKNVEWRSTDYDGHKVINACNYTWTANRQVYIMVNGRKVSDGFDLKNNESVGGIITLNSYEPRLIRVDGLSDINFKDIDGHWAEKYIEKMTLDGVLSGVSNTEFMPDKPITSQELLMALIRYSKMDCDYSEVFKTAKEQWNIKDKYLSDRELTREEVAELICAVCGIGEDNADISFMSDAAEVSEEAYGSVAALYKLGAMTGRSENTINPKDIFTRAEAVTVLSRLKEDLGN